MSHPGITASAVTIPARDGYPLGATLHLPCQVPVGLVLVHAATAVPARSYAPMRRLDMGEDLPGPAFRDWAHWIGQRRCFFDAPSMDAAARFARVRTPLLLVGADDDDPWTPAPAIDLLGSYFTGAPRERWQIDPADTATGRVGHAGFFREKHRDTLWPRIIDWLLLRTVPA